MAFGSPCCSESGWGGGVLRGALVWVLHVPPGSFDVGASGDSRSGSAHSASSPLPEALRHHRKEVPGTPRPSFKGLKEGPLQGTLQTILFSVYRNYVRYR